MIRVAPSELVVEDRTWERLERTLAGAPNDVVGVAAAVHPLPAGSSSLVMAERAGLVDPELEAHPGGSIRGAVVLRDGLDLEVEVDDGHVVVEPCRLLLDRSAPVHDPWADVALSAPSSPAASSPFPRRPVVVFLTSRSDERELDRLVMTVNELAERGDVEPRIASVAAPRGWKLTAPLPLDSGALARLKPDVLVAMDADTHELAAAAAEHARRTAVVHAELPSDDGVEWIPGRHGSDVGRLRARVGHHLSAERWTHVARRLSTGPQPGPPVPQPVAPEPDGNAPPRLFAPLKMVTAMPAPDWWISAMADVGQDQLDHRVLAPSEISDAASTLLGVDVLVAGSASHVDLVEVVQRRRSLGRPTLLVLDKSDLGPADAKGVPSLSQSVRRRLEGADGAVTMTPAVVASLAPLGRAGFVVPRQAAVMPAFVARFAGWVRSVEQRRRTP